MMQILEKTPGLLFTIMLLAFVIGTMVDSVMNAKEANEAPKIDTADVKK
jgi:cbb3-type cytochrome oxidase cytochrome c subunit